MHHGRIQLAAGGHDVGHVLIRVLGIRGETNITVLDFAVTRPPGFPAMAGGPSSFASSEAGDQRGHKFVKCPTPLFPSRAFHFMPPILTPWRKAKSRTT